MRDVCGPESDMPCPPCVCFITSKAKLKRNGVVDRDRCFPRHNNCLQSEFSLWDTGGGGPRVVLGLGLSGVRFLRFVRSARFLRGARRGPARPYLLAFSAHHPRPSSPPSRTHVLSCARRARSPPRWRQERLFNTLRWRCAAPAVTASCAASRLAERARRSTRHDTAPNIPRLARVLPALCPQSLLLTLSPRVSCAARPHVRRPSAARERSALWWRHELLCHRLWAAKGSCQRHTPPFSDRPSNQNGKATLASPARRLPETCAHRTVAYSVYVPSFRASAACEISLLDQRSSHTSRPCSPSREPTHCSQSRHRRISSLCGRAARSASALKRGRVLKMLLIRFQLFFASY